MPRRRAEAPLLVESDLIPDRGFAFEPRSLRIMRSDGDYWDEATWQAIEARFGASSPDDDLREAVRQAVFHYLAFVPRKPAPLKYVRRDLGEIEKAARRLRAALRRLPATTNDDDRWARERARGTLFTGLYGLGSRLRSYRTRSVDDFVPPPRWPGTAAEWEGRIRKADEAVEALLKEHPDPQLLTFTAEWYARAGGNPFLDQLDSLLATLSEVATEARGALPAAQQSGPKVEHPTLDRLAWKLRELLRQRRGPKAGAVTWDPREDTYTGDLYEVVVLMAPRLPPGSLPKTPDSLGKALQRALARGARTQFT